METPEINVENKESTPPVMAEEKKGNRTLFIVSIIVILIILIVGAYFLNSLRVEAPADEDIMEEELIDDKEINSIEEELDTTDLDNLDKELEEIEAEFESAVEV